MFSEFVLHVLAMRTPVRIERSKAAARQPEPHTVAHTLLIAAANKSSRGASRALLRSFGIGLVEWRVLRMLDTTGLDQVLPLCGSVEDALSRPARAEDAAPEARSTRH